MNRKLWYLKQLNLFKSLPEKQVQIISERFGEKEYSKRQVVLEPEDHDKVFILKSGRVEIYQLTADGKKIIIDTLGPGNVFGDLGLDEASDNFVEATTDSFVCVMNKNEFFEMVSKNQQIATTLVKELFTKIVESEKQVAALASDKITDKVKNLLFRLAKKHGEKRKERVVIPAKFTHEQLADMIGISRPTMTEMLNKLEDQKIIRRKNKIISFDPQKLENL
ncbi:Crp/Fnr family transcriptional regulator [Candidatus Curtissbacteria bacterium]|nr:Crp/Fnr family transcriptional regulator [Candidatus Curtissbacteria bacterium]